MNYILSKQHRNIKPNSYQYKKYWPSLQQHEYLLKR